MFWSYSLICPHQLEVKTKFPNTASPPPFSAQSHKGSCLFTFSFFKSTQKGENSIFHSFDDFTFWAKTIQFFKPNPEPEYTTTFATLGYVVNFWLESRICGLEIELGSVQCRTSENYKGFQKAERRVKELQFQQDEDHKNSDRMSELAGKLQQKIKTYKKQIEEAEEIAALNLAKYRKAQQELEEAEERSKMAGAQLSFARAGSVNL